LIVAVGAIVLPASAATPGADAGQILAESARYGRDSAEKPPAFSLPSPGGIQVSNTPADCAAMIAEVRTALKTDPQAKHPSVCVAGEQLMAGKSSTTAEQPSTATSIAWPPQCSAAAEPTGQWLAVDRRNGCVRATFGLIVYLIPSGAIIGTATFQAQIGMKASTSEASWTSLANIWVSSWSGVGFPQSSTGLLLGCPTRCVATPGLYEPEAPGAWQGTGRFDVTNLVQGEILENISGEWEITMQSSEYPGNTVTYTLPLAFTRCDNAMPAPRKPGCVFGNIPATVEFSQSSYPTFVSHIQHAQDSGLPGRVDSGTYLTRLTDTTLRDANRAKACPTSWPRPTGYSCDEYPFASTYQGAYTGEPGEARSFPGCQMPDPVRSGPTGWSRCFIVDTENFGAGGVLGGFYGSQRMLDGDPFQVGYKP
jgi:hypothetical protein